MASEHPEPADVGVIGRLYHSCSGVFWVLIQSLESDRENFAMFQLAYEKLRIWGRKWSVYHSLLDHLLVDNVFLHAATLDILYRMVETLLAGTY